jgi:hypothetical protein
MGPDVTKGVLVLFVIAALAGCVRGGFELAGITDAAPVEGGSTVDAALGDTAVALPDMLSLEALAPDQLSVPDLKHGDVSLVPYMSNLGGCQGCNLATQSCVGNTAATGFGLKCIEQPATDPSCTYTDGNDFRQCVYADLCDGWQFCYNNNAYAPCQPMPSATKSKILKTYGSEALDCLASL